MAFDKRRGSPTQQAAQKQYEEDRKNGKIKKSNISFATILALTAGLSAGAMMPPPRRKTEEDIRREMGF